MPTHRCYRAPSWLQIPSAIVMLLLIPNVFCGNTSSNTAHYNRYTTLPNDNFDYCTVQCKLGGVHTVCLYPQDGPGLTCSRYSDNKLSQSEKDAIVDKHNQHRNAIALGEVPTLPSASNMIELAWDEELAMIAQRWADQCKGQTDTCRDSRRGFFVNQNAIQTRFNEDVYVNPATRVQIWYDQIGSYSYEPGFVKYSPETAYFSQIVWGETRFIGCGRSRFFTNKDTQLLICNYGPGGNLLNKPLYDEGKPCSRCACSDQYPGLCAVGSILTA